MMNHSTWLPMKETILSKKPIYIQFLAYFGLIFFVVVLFGCNNSLKGNKVQQILSIASGQEKVVDETLKIGKQNQKNISEKKKLIAAIDYFNTQTMYTSLTIRAGCPHPFDGMSCGAINDSDAIKQKPTYVSVHDDPTNRYALIFTFYYENNLYEPNQSQYSSITGEPNGSTGLKEKWWQVGVDPSTHRTYRPSGNKGPTEGANDAFRRGSSLNDLSSQDVQWNSSVDQDGLVVLN